MVFPHKNRHRAIGRAPARPWAIPIRLGHHLPMPDRSGRPAPGIPAPGIPDLGIQVPGLPDPEIPDQEASAPGAPGPAGGSAAEHRRLDESRRRERHWARWGPYLSERAWGTVREDYSADGDAWGYFPHDHARSRAYRWNEDGLMGFCDRHGRVCLGLALWNGRDPILKERLFGLTGPEGNHGEDAKEYWFHLDALPSHAYAKTLYKYPHAEFPYARLVEENRRRGKDEPEFELIDTGVFEGDRYWDVVAEWAKGDDPEDLLLRVTATNRGPEAAELHLLPQVWFRNTWSWGERPQGLRPPPNPGPNADPGPSETSSDPGGEVRRSLPVLRRDGARGLSLSEPYYGERRIVFDGDPALLFTGNDTNDARLFGVPNASPYVKDAFHERVVHGREEATNPADEGTKAAAWYRRTLAPGESWTIRLRMGPPENPAAGELGGAFDAAFDARVAEADAFYAGVLAPTMPGATMTDDARLVARQALAGLLLSKQYYHYAVDRWLRGDPGQPPPPTAHTTGRNRGWTNVYAADVISMPDGWEYPWFAAWDLAFHTVPLALVDAEFAKEQITLLMREWYMHPNGQIPAYEWAFGDANPPVHAWAARRVYGIEGRRAGAPDTVFLERAFHKLLLNFTWWVNRKDVEGNNVFEGGFLGMDNVGLFDRSAPLPNGAFIEQSDGTSWMAFYSLGMLAIAVELARGDPAYEDTASKFWEHFLYIAQAATGPGNALWDEEDGFFYDVLKLSTGERVPMKVRSMVGLIPLLAVETLDPEDLARMPGFTRRMEWFVRHRPDLAGNVASMGASGVAGRRLLSLVSEERLRRVLRIMLDEEEFLSPYGLRSLSRRHKDRPYRLEFGGTEHAVGYEPGESTTTLFGGNSNWRGPVWMPVNYLLVEALQKYHHFYGDGFRVECPTGSGVFLNLSEVATELSRRLASLFLAGEDGARPAWGAAPPSVARDPLWRDLVPFHEYFHGDTGAGLGASHQTGWTALVAKLLTQSGG